jgi:3-hydroxyisobutyrate dehydrogenase
MVGGDAALVERAEPLLRAMGKSIFATGVLGSGHALKALNNYVSAAGLVAAVQATRVGAAFGISPDVIVDVFNASTGRNNSTEKKLKQFVLSETFASGFSLALMAKDLRTAADLAAYLKVDAPDLEASAELWQAALTQLGKVADHTEISRYLGLDVHSSASATQTAK